MRSFRILHIIDHLGMGGAQNVVAETINRQPTSCIYILRNKPSGLNIKNKQRVFHSNSSARYSLKPLQQISQIIRNRQIQILHCHLCRAQLMGWLVKFFYDKKIKLIFHEHGKIYSGNPLFRLFLQITIPRVDHYIAVSRSTKSLLHRRTGIPLHKIEVLYNPVDLKKFTSRHDFTERNKFGITPDQRIIGFAGRLIKIKGYWEFLRAVKIISNIRRDIKFLIAGSGSGRTKLIQLLKKLNLESSCRFLGQIHDMPTFYSSLDCFVVPSYFEAMGLTVVEAQAMGVPVICSDVPSLNEIVQDGKTGILFNLKSKYDLANKILHIIDNPAIGARLAKQAQADLYKYQPDRYIYSLEHLYDKILR